MQQSLNQPYRGGPLRIAMPLTLQPFPLFPCSLVIGRSRLIDSKFIFNSHQVACTLQQPEALLEPAFETFADVAAARNALVPNLSLLEQTHLMQLGHQ